MSPAVVAGASSSCSAAFTRNHPTKTTANPSQKPFTPLHCQKTTFQGVSLQDAKSGFSNSLILVADKNINMSFNIVRRGLEIKARTAGASKNIEVEVDKPLGLTLGQKPGGGVVITAVEGGGNASKAGLKSGDQVLYTSSFFGDELWPADKLGFTKTAIQAKPDSVYFVVSSFFENPIYGAKNHVRECTQMQRSLEEEKKMDPIDIFSHERAASLIKKMQTEGMPQNAPSHAHTLIRIQYVRR